MASCVLCFGSAVSLADVQLARPSLASFNVKQINTERNLSCRLALCETVRYSPSLTYYY